MKDRISACLKGIATGDAIGKQTEGLSREEVRRWPQGIRGFEGPPGSPIPRYVGNRNREWRMGETTEVAGIDYVGPLPAEVQRVTVFSAGIATSAKAPDAARALLRFLTSPAAVPAITKSGLEPVVSYPPRGSGD